MRIEDFERLLVSAPLRDPKAINRLSLVLAEDRFSNQVYRQIYETMLDMQVHKIKIDVATLSKNLPPKFLESVGGLTYLSDLASAITTQYQIYSTENIDEWAEFVDRAGRLRQSGQVIQSYADKYSDMEGLLKSVSDVDAFLAQFMMELRAITTITTSGYQHIGKFADEYGVRLGKALDGEPTDRLSTGLMGLDTFLGGGFPRGSLVIVAGLPSDGKTSLALEVTHAVGHNIRKKDLNSVALINSLETQGWRLVHRMACMYSHVNAMVLFSGSVGREHPDAIRVQKEKDRIAGLPIYIDDSEFASSDTIAYQAMSMGIDKEIASMMIDFAELVGDENKQSEEQRVSGIARKSKGLAKATGATVMLLSQYSRVVAQRPDMQGTAYDLRYSGALEAAADLIVHCYNPAQRRLAQQTITPPPEKSGKLLPRQYNNANTFEAYLNIDKNKEGSVGYVPVAWTPEYMLYSDIRAEETLDDF